MCEVGGSGPTTSTCSRPPRSAAPRRSKVVVDVDRGGLRLTTGRRRRRRRERRGTARPHRPLGNRPARTVASVSGFTVVKALTIATRVPLPSCGVSPMRACVRRSGRGLAAVSVLTPRAVARRQQNLPLTTSTPISAIGPDAPTTAAAAVRNLHDPTLRQIQPQRADARFRGPIHDRPP